MFIRWFMILVMSVTVGALGAAPQEPSQSDLNAMKAFFEKGKANNSFFEFTEMPCFMEHMCASGPIGSALDCERTLQSCLAYAGEGRSAGTEKFYTDNCLPLFAKLTPEQRALIAAPKACETPPPAAALKPAMTASEARCVGEHYCSGAAGVPASPACIQPYLSCATQMAELSGEQRAECRHSRSFALKRDPPWLSSSASGNCKIGMEDPVLWASNASQSSAIDWQNPPQSWQEQVDRTQQPSDDEFIADDLDF